MFKFWPAGVVVWTPELPLGSAIPHTGAKLSMLRNVKNEHTQKRNGIYKNAGNRTAEKKTHTIFKITGWVYQ